ncbi:MAG: hypothetical protein ACOH1Y_03495 [Propionicimonas sp.]
MMDLKRSRLGRLGAIALTTATLVAAFGVPSAEALENHECSVTVTPIQNGSYGGNTTSWKCKSATKVWVYAEAVVRISSFYYTTSKRWPTTGTTSYNGTHSPLTVAVNLDGVAELIVYSKVCYQWTTNVQKCRARSDSITLL